MFDLHFLNLEDVLQAHDFTLQREGGLPGIRDLTLLQSAIAMPLQMFDGLYLHDGVPAMAVAYLFHVTSNHPFLDGNKRTAALVAILFLDVNGMNSRLDPMSLKEVTLAVAEKRMTKNELTDWFRAHTEPTNLHTD